MVSEMNADRIAKGVRKALSRRMESARALVESKEHTARAREDAEEALTDLHEATQEEARRYRDARDSGWTTEDLRQAGLTEPVTESTQTDEPTDGCSIPEPDPPAKDPTD